MSSLQGIKQSVTNIFKKLSQTNTTETVNKMNPTAAKLPKAYEPMIKFVGTKHPILKHNTDKILPHPCTVNGLIPGGAETVQVADFMKNYTPFQVVPYKNSKANSSIAGSSKYQFTDRALKADEVSSINDLPLRFHYKPIDEAELEVINGGGAY